jgi:poly(3-hydroxybutyrate) depolymerase
MKKTAFVLAGCLLAAPALGKTRISKEALSYSGGDRTYYLYAPEELPDEPVPLLLTFHGSGRDGRSLVEKWDALARRHGFIVAGLDAANPQTWIMPNDGPGLVQALVDALASRYSVDERRLYLFGHSAGAVFAMKLGLMESEYFAAVAVHAGSFRQPQDFQVLELAKRKVPIKIIVGDRDAYFPLASVKATVKAFEESDLPVDLELIKGHDHWYYDRAKKFNTSAWEFLVTHDLGEAPRFHEYRFN